MAGQELPYLRLSQNKADVKGEGGSVSVTVSTNVEYEVVVVPTEAKEWLKQMETESAEELQFVALANEGREERCVDITVRGKNSDVTATLRVCQAGKGQEGTKPYLTLSANKVNVLSKGGAHSISVNTNIEYDVMIPVAAQDWINQVETDKNNFLVEVAFNKSTEERCTNITFKDKNSDLTATLQICQEAGKAEDNIADKFDPTFAQVLQSKGYIQDATYITKDEVSKITRITINNQQLTSLRGIEYFTTLKDLYCSDNQLPILDVKKNIALTRLECYNNQLPSLDISYNTKLTYFKCNENPVDWKGVFPVKAWFDKRSIPADFTKYWYKDGRKVTVEYIKANAAPFSKDSYTFAHEEFTCPLEIVAIADWQISISYDGEAGWLSVSPMDGGMGTETLTISAGANPINATRTAYIDIAYGDKMQRVFIKQAAEGNLIDRFDESFAFSLKQKGYISDYTNITVDDVKGIREIDVSNSNLNSLRGIEFFYGLRTLKCGNNQLSALNL